MIIECCCRLCLGILPSSTVDPSNKCLKRENHISHQKTGNRLRLCQGFMLAIRKDLLWNCEEIHQKSAFMHKNTGRNQEMAPLYDKDE